MTTSMDFETLGDKCKALEEIGTSLKFPSRGYLMARIDGHSFHTFTKKYMKQPMSSDMLSAMRYTAQALLSKFVARAAFVQSDEISLVWSLDETSEGSLFPFNGKAQKINSIMASYAAAYFNKFLSDGGMGDGLENYDLAAFDCRCWPLQSKEEVADNFLWRQWDAERNAINSVASWTFPAKSLFEVNTEKRVEMLRESGTPMTAFPMAFRFGTFITKETVEEELSPAVLEKIPESKKPPEGTKFKRTKLINTSVQFRTMDKKAREKLIFGEAEEKVEVKPVEVKVN